MRPDQKAAYERILAAQQEVDRASASVDVAFDEFVLALQQQRSLNGDLDTMEGAITTTNGAARRYLAAMKAGLTAVRELLHANTAEAELLLPSAAPPQ